MPCWATQLNEIDLTGMAGERLEILRHALRKANYHVYGTAESRDEYEAELAADHFPTRTSILVRGGRVIVVLSDKSTMTMQEATAQVKRLYSAEVVEVAAKRFGWNVTKQKENSKYRLERRF